MKGRNAVGTAVSVLVEAVLLLVCVLLIVSVGKWAYSFGYQVFAENTVEEEPGTDITVTIAEGQSNRDICQMLEDNGLIKNADAFYVRLLLTDYRSLLTPGTYTLNTSMQSEEMMAVMSGEPLEEEEE